jgi:hypothetical protein
LYGKHRYLPGCRLESRHRRRNGLVHINTNVFSLANQKLGLSILCYKKVLPMEDVDDEFVEPLYSGRAECTCLANRLRKARVGATVSTSSSRSNTDTSSIVSRSNSGEQLDRQHVETDSLPRRRASGSHAGTALLHRRCDTKVLLRRAAQGHAGSRYECTLPFVFPQRAECGIRAIVLITQFRPLRRQNMGRRREGLHH